MNEQGSPTPAGDDTAASRARNVRGGDDARPTAEILRELMQRGRNGLFSDAIIARLTGMVSDIARQLLHAVAAQSGEADRESFVTQHEHDLSAALGDSGAILAFAHACAVESNLTDALHESAEIDPALPSIVKQALASGDDTLSASAMHVLASQARFLHAARRMELPIGELPAEVFREALAILSATPVLETEVTLAATQALSADFDERSSRLAHLARFDLLLAEHDLPRSSLEDTGLALLATGMSSASGTGRVQTVLALGEQDPAHLVQLFEAADWPLQDAQQALAILHPHTAPLAPTDAVGG